MGLSSPRQVHSIFMFWVGLAVYFTAFSAVVSELSRAFLFSAEHKKSMRLRVSYMQRLSVPESLRNRVTDYFKCMHKLTQGPPRRSSAPAPRVTVPFRPVRKPRIIQPDPTRVFSVRSFVRRSSESWIRPNPDQSGINPGSIRDQSGITPSEPGLRKL